MTGITILDVGEYVETFGGAWSVGVVLLMVFGILTILLGGIAFAEAKGFPSCFMGVFALFIGSVMLMATLQGYKENGLTITVPRYKVTISDSVSYNEFTKKYKVLEVEGRIYTVVDKVEYETAKAQVEGS